MDLSKILFEGNKMNTEAFVYLWYDAPNKKYYLGWHKGTPDDAYTHSSTSSDEFCSIVPHSTRPISERREFFENIPEGVTRRILAYGTDVDMALLEHELLKNRKKRCWNRYYNKSVGDLRYVVLSGENHPLFGKKHSLETRKKQSESSIGKKHSLETRKKLSEVNSGENHPMFGKKLSLETRKKQSEAKIGKKLSLETRKKQSEAKIGENHPMYGKKHTLETLKKMSEVKIGKNNPLFGKKLSLETRKKMSEVRIGKKPSLETRKKLSEAKIGENNPNSRKNREARREKAERLIKA